MVLRAEYRVILPISCEEYRTGQLYCIGKASFEETKKAKGKEGVDIVENFAYETSHFKKNGGKENENENYKSVENQNSQDLNSNDIKKYEKRYTYKIFNMVNKMPEILQKWFSGSNKGKMHEACWNEFPFSKTVITNPDYMKDNFECIVETEHRDMDAGEIKNIHNINESDWSNTSVVHVHLDTKTTNEKAQSNYEIDNPFVKVSTKHPDILPLDKDWRNKIINSGQHRYMCIYKLVTVKFKWWGLQSIMEKVMLGEQEKMIRAFHRYILCEIDNWGGMTSEDLIDYEIEIQRKCNVILSSANELPEDQHTEDHQKEDHQMKNHQMKDHQIEDHQLENQRIEDQQTEDPQ